MKVYAIISKDMYATDTCKSRRNYFCVIGERHGRFVVKEFGGILWTIDVG
jgi:hypothetical protein